MQSEIQAEIAQLIEQHKKLIFKVVYSYCTDVHEQEDLTQEIILQLLKSYEKFDHKVKVTTWMYRVALNVAISHYRKIKSRQKYIVPMPDKLVKVDTTKETGINEDVVRLRSFIREFEPLNKAILIMYLDGNSHAEIAAAMGISVSNVGTKISRLKQELKKKFKQQ